MARKYQGYARKRGFRQRDPGYGSLSRLREQGNQVIRDLQEDRAEQRSISEQYNRDLDSNFKRSQQNQAELYQFESTVQDRRNAAVNANNQTRIRNAETEARNSDVLYKQLGEFVPSLFQEVQKGIELTKEAEQKAAFVSSVLNDPIESFEASPAYQEAENVFNQNEEAYQRIGDNMEGMVSQGAIQEYRSDSPAIQKTSLENRLTMAEMAVDSTLTTYGEAPMQLKRLMDQYGLYDVNRVKLYSLAKKVQERRSALFEAESKVRAKDLSFTRIQGEQNNFIANPTANGVSQLMTTISRGTEDGVKRNGMSFAVDKMFGKDSLLDNTALIDDFTYDQIINDPTWPGGQYKGQTIAQRFPDLVKLQQQRRLITLLVTLPVSTR